MSKSDNFIKNGKCILEKNTVKAIHDLLGVLDSEVEYPMNRDKLSINETRLLSVVKSRGQAYNTAVKLADEIGLDRSRDVNLKSKFIKGLKTTFNEMNKIIIRDIRKEEEVFQINDEADQEIADVLGKGTNPDLSDDYIASIAKTKEEAYFLNKQILERIGLLENPEEVMREKLENIKSVSIAELYVEN
ncbi:hypothetical protein ACMGDK_11440 [Chryseobacterium sp. DT-3]|uniref:hypothetical protein n=1 Tax=Chryseobacterium sp. DT-3 TaxID=3396164 RepID=UPI003F1B57DE